MPQRGEREETMHATLGQWRQARQPPPARRKAHWHEAPCLLLPGLLPFGL